MKMELQNT